MLLDLQKKQCYTIRVSGTKVEFIGFFYLSKIVSTGVNIFEILVVNISLKINPC